MATVRAMDEAELRRQILAIHTDTSLSESDKAKRRQALLSGSWQKPDSGDEQPGAVAEIAAEGTTIFDESLQCTMCMELCNRPVTAPCQHNFCLGCFNKWVNQSKKTCPTCRHPFPAKFAANPRINTALASAIRMAKLGIKRPNANKAIERMNDKDRPDEAFTTDRAVRAGRANASSGRIMVTVPGDWFGPIPAEHDPIRGTGVLVGEHWKDRLDCRQWGAHFPHVAGIAGQSNTGSQSVVLSGGYEDDRDEGEWFLYTGSGGRDLSGNKRVTNVQSFDQTFDKMNKALLVSCQKGLPVRVVRSFKEKRSSYAPTENEPVRYDGVYRIVRAYRKAGNQGKLVCRYVFVRCDNAAAPWASVDALAGDGPWDGQIPEPAQDEIKQAKGKVFEMGSDPWWGYDAEKKEWGWTRDPPISQKQGGDGTSEKKNARRKVTEHERALKEFKCKLCSGVLKNPLSTPCGHHFCKPCIERVFEGVGDVENRAQNAGRALRERKTVKPCPTCQADIAEFLSTAQVNRGMVDVIAKLQEEALKAAAEAAREEAQHTGTVDKASGADEEVLQGAEVEAAVRDGEGADQGAPALAREESVVAQAEAAVAPAGCGQGEARPPAKSEVAAAAKPKSTKDREADKAAAELEALAAQYPQFDRELVQDMVQDQGGDIEEVHACLRRMANQTLAAERKAKRAAAAAEASTTSSPPISQGRKPAAKKAAKAAEGDVPASGEHKPTEKRGDAFAGGSEDVQAKTTAAAVGSPLKDAPAVEKPSSGQHAAKKRSAEVGAATRRSKKARAE